MLKVCDRMTGWGTFMTAKAWAICLLVFCVGLIAGVFIGSNTIKTPFDQIDQDKAAIYRARYDDGYAWAKGQHFLCPPSPATIHSPEFRWVADAWVAGYMTGRAEGGQSPIPARFTALVPADVPRDEIP